MQRLACLEPSLIFPVMVKKNHNLVPIDAIDAFPDITSSTVNNHIH